MTPTVRPPNRPSVVTMFGAHFACSSDAGGGLVEQRGHHRLHVVGAVGLGRHERGQVATADQVGRVDPALPAQQRGEGTGGGERAVIVLCGHVHHAGAPAVRLGAAQALHVDLLAGDAAHDLGAGHEDATAAAHDDDVGQRRTVRGPAGGRPEHDRELRHPPGGADHRGEDLPDRVEGDHALGQPGAAGVPEADDRDPFPDREVDRVHDVVAAVGTHRAAHPGGVGGERDDGGAVDLARGRSSLRSRRAPRAVAGCPGRTEPAAVPPGRGSRRAVSSATRVWSRSPPGGGSVSREDRAPRCGRRSRTSCSARPGCRAGGACGRPRRAARPRGRRG